MSNENVHCNSASVVPSFWLSGPVNSVHTYCGLEIAIMAIKPRTSWFQRFQYQAEGTVVDGTAVDDVADMAMPPPVCRQSRNRPAPVPAGSIVEGFIRRSRHPRRFHRPYTSEGTVLIKDSPRHFSWSARETATASARSAGRNRRHDASWSQRSRHRQAPRRPASAPAYRGGRSVDRS